MSNAEATIRDLVSSKKVVLFMKGSRHFPQCGFSAQVVEILNGLVPAYETVNVLADPEMRDAIKRYSDWPTIPQLYVNGKFVGGCDIVKEMFASGELAETLVSEEGVSAEGVSAEGVSAEGVSAEGVSQGAASKEGPSKEVGAKATTPSGAPVVTVTPVAAKAIGAARETPEDELRFVVSPSFEHELFFDGAQPGDILVDAGGITLRLDPESAKRAHGARIDFVDAASGGGFAISNPAAPPKAAAVRSMTPKALKAAFDSKEPLTLFDVRTASELAQASVTQAIHLDDEGQRRLAALPKNTKLVFMCHHGMRSRVAAESALRQGFTNVWNLEGGIDAWSSEVDSSIPKY